MSICRFLDLYNGDKAFNFTARQPDDPAQDRPAVT